MLSCWVLSIGHGKMISRYLYYLLPITHYQLPAYATV